MGSPFQRSPRPVQRRATSNDVGNPGSEAIAALFEQLPQGYAEAEVRRDAAGRPIDLRYLRINPAFEPMFEVRRSGLLAAGSGLDALPDLTRLCLDALDDDAPRQVAIDGRHGHRSFQVRCQSSIDNPDRVHIVVDETAHREATEQAQAARISDERFRAMADAAPVLLWETDETGVVFVNGHYLDYFGVGFAHVREMGWANFLHPEDAQAYRDAYQQACQSRVPYTAECRFRRADGEYRWLRSSGRSVGDGRFVGYSIDISDLHEARTVMRASESRYRALVGASNQVLYRHNPDWSQMRQLTGNGFLADTERPDSNWFNAYIHPDDQPHVWAAIERAIRTKSMFELEHRVLRADGTLGWMLSRSVPVLDEKGEILEWFGAAADITRRRQIEGELRESEERLATLVGELQHRTRNLMGVVRAMADKTLRASTDLEDFEGKFRDRLGALARVQSLLSRMGDHERISFDELLRAELVAHGVLGLDDRRVTLKGPESVRLRSRTVQTLALALHELATNAIKYGGLGSPKGRLSIEWWLAQSDAGVSHLHVDWRERGVRMPPPETVQPGQGTELIERALPYQLQATTSFELEADGVHCTIAFPVSD